MKKIEIFIGSPRKNGNTVQMADMLRMGLPSGEVTCKVNFLYDQDIKPCIDCRNCTAGRMECTLKDGMSDIYPIIEDADIIVVGTPVYWSGPTAVTKLLLDRFRPFYRNRRLSGKSIALLLPAGDGAPDCDLTIEMFRRAAILLDLRFAGAVTAKAYDIGDLSGDAETGKAVNELIENLSR